MRIALAGSGYYGAAAFLPLLHSRHEVVALLQNGRAARGLRRVLGPMLSLSLGSHHGLARVARRDGIPIFWIDEMSHTALRSLAQLAPDLLVVAGFSIILKTPLLKLPGLGCVNIHASLLPHHRGPNPFSAVVLAGESESGVTFHIMDEGIDTGPILDQSAFPLEPRETAQSVYLKSAETIAQNVVRVIDRIERAGLHGTLQDPQAGNYDKKPEPGQLYIDWRQPASAIDRMVRAYSPFLMARFRCGRRTVRVLESAPEGRTANAAPGTVVKTHPNIEVATGEGTLRILSAVSASPLAWPWPAPWSTVRKGAVLR